MNFNHAQQEALSHDRGPCLVLAGPGSGKTLTIVQRVACLIRHQKAKPEEILVITFTKYAAKEMQLRFLAAMEGRHVPVIFGTFHSIYFHILKEAYHWNGNQVLSGREKNSLLEEVLTQDMKATSSDRESFLTAFEQEISSVKNHGWDLLSYEAKCCDSETFRQLFETYETKKRQVGKIDFEDMLLMCLQLFQSHPAILRQWQQKFRYFLVDEFQDSNRIQYEVLKLLAMPDNNLFVVGDDDQSIYAFRGAYPTIMRQFLQDYPDARQILLDVNYRSGARIVDGSLQVISHNVDRFPKEIHAAKKAGEPIHIEGFQTIQEESHRVAAFIEELLNQGLPATEIGVLYRRAQDGNPVAEALSMRNIPFWMQEQRDPLYHHFISQDIISYLSLAQGPLSRKQLLRVINRPNRGIFRETLESPTLTRETFLALYQDNETVQRRARQLMDDLQFLQELAPYGAIQYLRTAMGYEQFLLDEAGNRGINPEKFLQVLEELQERSRSFASIGDWLSQVAWYEEHGQGKRKEHPGEEVSLLTMHGAKGLEFDTVFLLGANAGVMPHQKAQLPEEVEEERRLFYVAMTRAKHRLFVSYVREKQGKEMAPSIFLQELLEGNGSQNGENVVK